MNEMFQLEGTTLRIILPQELDHPMADLIRKGTEMIAGRTYIRTIVFDFSETEFMDSSGIGVIMGRYRHIFLLGGEVWAIHTSERMRQILNMSGVTKIIQIYEEGMM